MTKFNLNAFLVVALALSLVPPAEAIDAIQWVKPNVMTDVAANGLSDQSSTNDKNVCEQTKIAASTAFFQGDYKYARELAYQVAKQISSNRLRTPGAEADLISGGSERTGADLVDCLNKPDATDKLTARVLINLGMCHIKLGELDKAEDYFAKAQKLIEKQVTVNPFNAADCLMGLAECHYMQGQTKKALREYSEAISFYEQQLGRWSPELVPALEGIGGSYYQEKQFNEAIPVFKQIVQIDLKEYGPESARLGLSLNNLCDAYYKIDDCSNARKLFEQAVWIFRKSNYERLLANIDQKAEDEAYAKDKIAIMKERVKSVVMGNIPVPDIAATSCELLKSEDFDGKRWASSPRSARFSAKTPDRPNDFENWRFTRRPPDEPLFLQIDPEIEQKGLIVCLHGLGLHSRSFDDFAHKMNPFGYGVLALDVRGFGSLSFEKSQDKVYMDAGLEDLGAAVSLFRSHNSKLPIFVLGESMGGCLALQFAAKFPELLDGLISSVPSGSRYKSASTNLLVGINLLKDKKKQFEIGKRVVEQATMDEELKESWLSNPNHRLKLSAEELVNFQQFMNHTKEYAGMIKNIPVIIFQGFQDHLAKPEGTYALYELLSTKQKDLVLVGAKGHLIFEEGQAPKEIVRMLAAWMDSRILN